MHYFNGVHQRRMEHADASTTESRSAKRLHGLWRVIVVCALTQLTAACAGDADARAMRLQPVPSDCYEAVVRALYAPHEVNPMEHELDGLRYTKALARYVASFVEDGVTPEAALDKARYRNWGRGQAEFTIEQVGQELQVTYIGVGQTPDGWRCWRAEIR